MLAVLKSSGTCPEEREEFNILVIKGKSSSTHNFTSHVGTGSRLLDLEANELTSNLTWLGVTGSNEVNSTSQIDSPVRDSTDAGAWMADTICEFFSWKNSPNSFARSTSELCTGRGGIAFGFLSLLTMLNNFLLSASAISADYIRIWN